MAFRLRGLFGRAQPTVTAYDADSEPLSELSLAVRVRSFRDYMISIADTAARLAEEVKLGRVPAKPAGPVNPLDGPFDITHLSRLFKYREGGKLSRSCFLYFTVDGKQDVRCQFQLYDLATGLVWINAVLASAATDSLGGNAGFRRSIDMTLARSAFFAAYFENLETTLDVFKMIFVPRPGQEIPIVDWSALMANINRSLRKYAASALSADDFVAAIPQHPWPHFAVEGGYPKDPAELFVNAVYFPPDHASVMRKHLAEMQASAFRHS